MRSSSGTWTEHHVRPAGQRLARFLRGLDPRPAAASVDPHLDLGDGDPAEQPAASRLPPNIAQARRADARPRTFRLGIFVALA
jgi:hypothetical protein